MYFNPRTHRGVRLMENFEAHSMSSISIHAPIVGCDEIEAYMAIKKVDFNPRTHRGVRLVQRKNAHNYFIFQSTHPSWGATGRNKNVAVQRFVISIHAPIVGCDFIIPTLHDLLAISIHAPIVGCDDGIVSALPVMIDFNPRTHRGVRRTKR